MKEELKEKFTMYVSSNFDMENSNIKGKLAHSLRVMELCRLIGHSNGFSDEDIEIASIIGLLHDYARFYQWTKYQNFKDLETIDHGDFAIEMLFSDSEILSFCQNIGHLDEIFDGIKYHNKATIPDHLSEHNKKLLMLIKDADKLDNLYMWGRSEGSDYLKGTNTIIHDDVKENFYKHQYLKFYNGMTDNDYLIGALCFVYDLYFLSSLEYLKKEAIFDKIYENINYKEIYEPYFDEIKKYIDERIG